MSDWNVITQVGARPLASTTRILVADADPGSRRWLREVVAGEYPIDEVEASDRALELIANATPRIVIVGLRLADMTGSDLLARAGQWLGERDALIRIFLLADAAGAVADVDESRHRVFYRLVPTMHASRVRELLAQAAAKLPAPPPTSENTPPDVAARVANIGAQQDPSAAAREAIESVIALVGATRARCLYCDEEAGTMWPEREGDDAVEINASVGAAGFAIRTGASLAIPRGHDDPLYRKEIDDPQGSGRERLAVQPVVGLDGHVHAVLIAVRDHKHAPFSPAEMATLEALATAWAPYLQQLAMRVEAEDILGDRLDSGPSDIFRHEAIESLVRRGARGDVVRVHPGWVRAAYWLVLVAVIGGVLFAAFAHVHEYAEGPAIVRFAGRSEVVAHEPGTVTAIDVKIGDRVKEGQALARLHDAEQLARLRSLDSEFERKLVAYLQTPTDQGVRQALSQIRSDRETARAGVDAKVISSQKPGIVKEIHVRTGQRVDAGTVVISLAERGETEGLSVYAFLPGSQRPKLRAHQQLSLMLPGYRGARIETRVVGVTSQVLPANEAKMRFLGERTSESLPTHGTVVVVEATLASPTFEADGATYQLHDGMVGVAEVRLASRSLLDSLLPERR